MNVYIPGETAVISATFLDPDSRAGLTVTALKLRILDPTGTEADAVAGFANPTAGKYTFGVVVTIPGVWNYRWEVTAPFAAACEGALTVKKTIFTPD